MCVSLCAHIVGTTYWLLRSVCKLNLITWPASPTGGQNTAAALFILITVQDSIHPVIVSKGIQLLTYLYGSGIKVGYLMNCILPHHLCAEQTYEVVARIIPTLQTGKLSPGIWNFLPKVTQPERDKVQMSFQAPSPHCKLLKASFQAFFL